MTASPRMDQVFYNAHSKASHYILRHTSHRFRAIIEHVVLALAICAFCTVILSHRAFVHREDIACLYSEEEGGGVCGESMSLYSMLVQVVRWGYNYFVLQGGEVSWSNYKNSGMWPMNDRQVPLVCLKSIPGFREDADVNHILHPVNDVLNGGEGSSLSLLENNNQDGSSSRAFTIYRGHANERLVTGVSFGPLMQQSTCVIDNYFEANMQQQEQYRRTLTQRLGLRGGHQMQLQQQQQYSPCSKQMVTFLSNQGYLPTHQNFNNRQSPTNPEDQLTNNAIYSYSHSHGLLSLTPNLQHAHNISTQFIIPSTTDENCFGEPFLKSIIFRLVGPDTVILNWILGLQHVVGNTKGMMRPRFVYHWKGKKLIDLDIYDKDHYAFASRSSGDDNGEATNTSFSSSSKSINALISKLRTHPLLRLLKFITFRLSVLLSSLFIFFLTTSLVSFTLQETQDRMLEFTLQLKDRVRNRLPLTGLIVRHVLENLVFVPIMVGMIFFLIEYYGGDKFLAFSVLSMVWLCEVFSAISIRSAQGIHFFPRVFFLYFTFFHVYFFSCPVGFTYASLVSTMLFLFHTILFFWNRYELPALHSGLITPQSPRAIFGGGERGGWENTAVSAMNVGLVTPQSPRTGGIASAGRGDWNNNNNSNDHGTDAMAPPSFIPQPYLVNETGSPMRFAVAAASTSIESIRSLTSMHSLTSLAERTPNFLFHGGHSLNDSVDTYEEDDSYTARVGRSGPNEFNSFHHRDR